ncbi:hypothetical protein FC65_GL000081 [Ligilactobacillus acidipiscis DSM 15836]|nr:hypothetical protein FC65_GL000081 [Ligilactobacillus acidipiscis DSM 15836]
MFSGGNGMERTDYYIVITRSGKVKKALEATRANLKKAQQLLKESNGHLSSGNIVMTKDDIEPNGEGFLILINGQVKDKVVDFDEAQENAHTYQTALEALDTSSNVQIVQIRRDKSERKPVRLPFEGLDELTLKRFHMNRKRQQNCEYCHPSYPAQPYQGFNFCPHCGRYLH